MKDLKNDHFNFLFSFSAEPPAGQIDPLSDKSNQIIRDIVKEGTEKFPDTFYHSGGDEINTSCWETNSGIKRYMKKYKKTAVDIWMDWTKKLLDYIIIDLKKRPIIWEDSIKDGYSYPNRTIVQTWTTNPSRFTSLGYDVIVSNSDYFYLDCGEGGKL
jgi:hexosaminidase